MQSLMTTTHSAVHGMSELTINLLTDKESTSAIQSLTRMIGTIGGTFGRKRGKDMSASISTTDLEQFRDSTEKSSPTQSMGTLNSNDYHVIGSSRLDMPQFTIHPGKILEKNISIMKDKKLVGVVSARYIYVPVYRRKVVS